MLRTAQGDRAAGKAATGRLLIWPSGHGAWMTCPTDEITWLDRGLLSGNEDLTLHRPPRCAGLRYVHHQWELFSRDTTHEVYLAPHEDETPLDHRAVQAAARHVLPVAPAQHYETLPVVLEQGEWLVSVGTWVLPLGSRRRPAASRRTPPGGATSSHPPRSRRKGPARPAGAAGTGRRRRRTSAPTSSATAPPGWPWPSSTRSTSSACPPPSRCR